jgi:hypothetical protein
MAFSVASATTTSPMLSGADVITAGRTVDDKFLHLGSSESRGYGRRTR